jgi:urease accessory protein UreF
VDSLLVPVELPLISRGFELASCGAIRELITLDREHVPMGLGQSLALASRKAGRAQLGRMRPLRGERRVTRYWRAVQRGEARGWHTVVFGLVLAVYSLPLRQGLIHYGRLTIRSFVDTTRTRLDLDEVGCAELAFELESRLTPAIGGLLPRFLDAG